MKTWLKVLCVVFQFYSIIGGLLLPVPRLAIVNETIRGLYYHVPMWFAMVTLFTLSFYQSTVYLRKPSATTDTKAQLYANVGVLFGLLGIFTGMIWANYTWGSPWHGDPKQNGAAIALLVYFAYFILRGSVENDEQKARLSAVYNIFAFVTMIPLIFIIPRMTSSMHPGNGGNPGFNMYDLDSQMRLVFYPACVGWILLGLWIANLRIRMKLIEDTLLDFPNEK
jgi:heme exporter protein C